MGRRQHRPCPFLGRRELHPWSGTDPSILLVLLVSAVTTPRLPLSLISLTLLCLWFTAALSFYPGSSPSFFPWLCGVQPSTRRPCSYTAFYTPASSAARASSYKQSLRPADSSSSKTRRCSVFLLAIVAEASQGFPAQPPHLHVGLSYSNVSSPIELNLNLPCGSYVYAKHLCPSRALFFVPPFCTTFPLAVLDVALEARTEETNKPVLLRSPPII